MMIFLTMVGAIIFVAAGCFILLRDLYNIAEALTSGMDMTVKEAEGKSERIQLKNAYVVR